MTVVISAENLSKSYRLGQIGTGTFTRDLELWLAKLRGKPNPLLKIGETDHDNRDGEDLWALKDVSFKVEQGEVLGIIGKNGAGKSTLLKILSRVTAPTSGKIKVKGRIASLLEVGTGFHPELTGRENIYLNGAILGMNRQEVARKFDEIVDFSEVEKFIDTPVKRYSSGMYVRLAFAVAAHLEPEILVVDEVLAVGDLEFQNKCLGKMQDVTQKGRTVLFVSHNMSAVASLCPRAVLLARGRVVTDGPSTSVINDYVSTALKSDGLIDWRGSEKSPGMHGFNLVGVSILNGSGMPVNSVDVEQNIRLRMEYHTSVPGLKFRCAAVFKHQGIGAFTTIEPMETIHEKPGYYCSSVEVPGNLLADGDYTVSVSAFTSKGQKMLFCREKDIIAFKVYDRMTGRTARGDYPEALAGLVRPKLSWKIDHGKDLRLTEVHYVTESKVD